MANKKEKKSHESNSEEITRTFTENERYYERLKDEVFFTLTEELDKTDIKIHSIPSRIKKLDSFLNKIGLYRIEKPFEEINDIVGLRVICLFLTDIEKIGNIIRENFEVIKEDNKVDNSKFASFGYLSVHFIAKLGKNFSGTRYNNILDMPFEVQVRTIAMDAWANISHYLDYKTDKDIPEELKRDFYALSGMFYVADKHFQLFFEQREENNEEIQETDINSQPINLDTLKIFLREKFPDKVAALDLSPYVQLFTQAKFNTIGEINDLLEKSKDAGEAYFQDNFKEQYAKTTDVAFCMVSLQFVSYEFHIVFTNKYARNKTEEITIDDWNKAFKKYRALVKK